MAEQVKPVGSKPKSRLSGKIREAVRLMVEDGLTRPQAAEKTGLQDNSLYKALRRPDVRSLRNELLRGCRESAASGVVKRVLDLATGAKSDAVKLDANRFLADVAQEGPVHRGEITHHHQGMQQPGLTICFNEFRTHTVDTVTGQVTDGPALISPPIRMIGTPQPHPEGGRRIPVRVPHPSEASK